MGFDRCVVTAVFASTAALVALLPGSDSAFARPPSATVCATDVTVDAKAGQVLLALVDNPADAKFALDAGTIAGIAPFGTVSRDELAALTSLLERHDAPLGILVASDEEGGRVQRFGDVISNLPSAATQAETMTPTEVEALYTDYGNALRNLGVTMAFAPVVDVGGGPAIGSRSYGDDPQVVAHFAVAAVAGYQAAGITPVIKHFPGHGRASGDTHNGAATTPALESLHEIDLLPYVELLSRDAIHDDSTTDIAVMVGHLDVPGLTDGTPASMSSAAIAELLRDELGFSGLVISDALGMGAILQFATPAEAAVQFLIAGGDLAIVNLADSADIQSGIVDAVESGRLSEDRLDEALSRVLNVKGFDTTCGPLWQKFAIGLVTGTLQ